MLKNKFLFLFGVVFIFLLSLNLISASVTIAPSKITLGNSAKFTIDLPEYNSYVYFYRVIPNSNLAGRLVHLLDLNCDKTCKGKMEFDYVFNPNIFPVGNYAAVIDTGSELIEFKFEIVAGELEECTDSDGGKNYYVRGSATASDSTIDDACVDAIIGGEMKENVLREYFCINGQRDYVHYECPNGCSDGACIGIVEEGKCSDSDGGKDYYVYGEVKFGEAASIIDYCYGTNLHEGYCLTDNAGETQDYECPNGCKDGACVGTVEQGKCSDTTELGKCSIINMPKSCKMNGIGELVLLNDCWECSCPPEKEYCQPDGSCSTEKPSQSNCYEGTLVGECSLDKPYSCNLDAVSGIPELIANCKLCGCPDVYPYCQDDGSCDDKEEVKKCDDGTAFGQCSTTKPKFCDGQGSLIDDCNNCRCPSDSYVCQEKTGKCILIPPVGWNIKRPELYPPKNVFLISEELGSDWKKFLPLVPAVVWTGAVYPEQGQIKKYPLIIDDSLINDKYDFIEEYAPRGIFLIGDESSSSKSLEREVVSYLSGLTGTSGLSVSGTKPMLRKIKTEDYLRYWKSFSTLVYVEDNYELALLASTYASLLNAPLIIKGTEWDMPEVLSGRKIICVADDENFDSFSPSAGNCHEKYTLDLLQKKYLYATEKHTQESGRLPIYTDKIIIINPDDINNDFKTSLIAPLLASAKHELLLSTKEIDYQKIDSFIEEKIKQFDDLKILNYDDSGINYLTIMADFDSIPHRLFNERMFSTDLYWALDPSHYADINGDNLPELAVGRIAGDNIKDISNYVSRILFYDTFQKTNNMKFMASSHGGSYASYAERISNIFKGVGYNVDAVTTDIEGFEFNADEWKNQDLIFYIDHGSTIWAGIYEKDILALKNSLVLARACFTVSKQDSFWSTAIRNGAIAYLGAVGISVIHSRDHAAFLNNIYYLDKLNIGEAFKNSYESTNIRAMTTLIGDPTLDISPEFKINHAIGGLWGVCLWAGETCQPFQDLDIPCSLGLSCSTDPCCPGFSCKGDIIKGGYKCMKCENTDTNCGLETCKDCTIMAGDANCKGNIGKPCVCDMGECKDPCKPNGTFVLWDKTQCCSGKVGLLGDCVA